MYSRSKSGAGWSRGGSRPGAGSGTGFGYGPPVSAFAPSTNAGSFGPQAFNFAPPTQSLTNFTQSNGVVANAPFIQNQPPIFAPVSAAHDLTLNRQFAPNPALNPALNPRQSTSNWF